MPTTELREVTREEAERIWVGKCPVCGGNLLVGPSGGISINVKCENGCKAFNVPPRPFLPQRI